MYMQFNEQLGFKTPSGIRASIQAIDYYPFHSHKTYIEIICVLSGSYTVHDCAVTYTLNENEIHIFNSTYPHKIEANEENSTLLMIHIDKRKYLDYDNMMIGYFIADSQYKENVLFPEMKLLRFYMAKAYSEYIKPAPSAIELDAIARDIIDLLFEQFHDYAYHKLENGTCLTVRRKYDGRNEDEFYRIYRIADYLEIHFKESVKLTDIAEQEFLSVPYLSKYIKKNIGITFSELVSIIRCDEAERLLATSNHSIEQIASMTGFANRAHLFSNFTKWFSQSPSQHRKSILNDLNDQIKIRYSQYDTETIQTIIDEYLNG